LVTGLRKTDGSAVFVRRTIVCRGDDLRERLVERRLRFLGQRLVAGVLDDTDDLDLTALEDRRVAGAEAHADRIPARG
jgi:hypothetical protein